MEDYTIGDSVVLLSSGRGSEGKPGSSLRKDPGAKVSQLQHTRPSGHPPHRNTRPTQVHIFLQDFGEATSDRTFDDERDRIAVRMSSCPPPIPRLSPIPLARKEVKLGVSSRFRGPYTRTVSRLWLEGHQKRGPLERATSIPMPETFELVDL